MKLKGWQRVLVGILRMEKPYIYGVAKEIDMTYSATKIVIDKLELEGYITSEKNNTRKRTLTLLDKGKKIAEALCNENYC